MLAAGDGLVNIRLLIEKADINQRDKEGKTALTYAKKMSARRSVAHLIGAIEFEHKEKEESSGCIIVAWTALMSNE